MTKRKTLVSLASIMIIASVVMVAGCLESSTPEATPTPTPTPTVAPELEYLENINGLSNRMSDILARFNAACTDFNEGKIGLATFEYIVNDCSDDMYAVAIEAAFLSPPPGYEEFHGHWIKSINLCDSAMFEMVLFFVDEDINHIYLATDIMKEGNREAELATAALP